MIKMSKETKRWFFVGGFFLFLSVVCVIAVTYFPVAARILSVFAVVFAFLGGARIWFEAGKYEKRGELIDLDDLEPGSYQLNGVFNSNNSDYAFVIASINRVKQKDGEEDKKFIRFFTCDVPKSKKFEVGYVPEIDGLPAHNVIKERY